MKFLSLKNFLKLLWAFTYIFSSLGLSLYIYELYMKYNFNPDIMTTEKIISSNEIPMPAITICSPVIMRLSSFNFDEYWEENEIKIRSKNATLDQKNDQLYALWVLICNTPWAAKHNWRLHNENHVKLLNESFEDVEEFFFQCEYQKSLIKCGKLFRKVLTHFGFCYSFNLLDFKQIFNAQEISEDFKSYENSKVSNWSVEKGFDDDDIYPLRVLKRNQIHARLHVTREQYENMCGVFGEIFMIFLHLPNEMLTPLHTEYTLQFGMKKDFIIEPRKYSADESLRSYTPEQRRCFFEGERKLKFFSSYTKTLCEFECLTNFTLKSCDCVKFSMPRSNDTKVCNWNDSKCVLNSDSAFVEIDENKNSPQSLCNCLPTCNDIKYHVKGEKSSRYSDEVFELRKGTNHVLVFEFPSANIVVEEKFVAYRLQDFVADCGGLSGLFLGFSFLTIVEMIENLLNHLSRRVHNKVDKDDGSNLEAIQNEINLQMARQNVKIASIEASVQRIILKLEEIN